MPDSQQERYLKFLSKLYDLAADFDRRQLQAIQGIASREGNEVVEKLAALFMDIRGDRVGTPRSKKTTKSDSLVKGSVKEILRSKRLFPSNYVLAKFVKEHLPSFEERDKESRERLVGRIAKEMESVSQTNRRNFLMALEKHIATQNGGSDFVGRWSKLIRQL